MAGFSMSEMVITISILGILATIAIISMNGAFQASKDALAVEKMEMLNAGIIRTMNSVGEPAFPARKESGEDEQVILMAMRHRRTDEDRAYPGSPFVNPRLEMKTSNSDADFRLRWTGLRYELLRPGDTGVGLKVVFDGSDIGKNPPTIDPSNVFGK